MSETSSGARRQSGRVAATLTRVLAATLFAASCQPSADFTVGESEFVAPPGSMAPNLSVEGDRVLLSWLEPTPAGHALRVAERDAGTWRAAGVVVEHDSLFVNWADFPSVTALPDGRWVAHWLEKTAPETYAYHVRMAISVDEGASWDAPFTPHGDRSPTEHGFVALVPWTDGAALVWLDGRNTGGGAADAGEHGATGAMTLRATTIGAAGEPAEDVEVDDRICDCCQTDIARAGSAALAVYRDRSDAEIRDVAIARFAGGAWSPPTRVADDGWYYPGCPVNGPSIAAREALVAVAWFTGAHDTARVLTAFSRDGGETFGPPVRIDGGRPVGRTDVVLAPRDTAADAIVSWIEQADDGATVQIRRVRPDGTMGQPHTVAHTSAARSAGFPRLVRLGGVLVVAWTAPEPDARVRVVTIRMRS